MPKPRIDKLSAAFTSYLLEVHKIEKDARMERVLGKEKGPGAVRPLLDKRMASLRKCLREGKRFRAVPQGLGTGFVPSREDLERLIPPPRPRPVFDMVCNLDREMELDQATYVLLGSDDTFNASGNPAKNALASAQAGVQILDTFGSAHVGYWTTVDVPPAGGTTMVTLLSRLASTFSWFETSALSGGVFAEVMAVARMWVTFGATFQQCPQVTLAQFSAEGGQQFTVNDLPSPNPGAQFELEVTVPSGPGTVVNVFETVEVTAISSLNGHAFINGSFTWEPLRAHLREGCRVVSHPGFRGFGSYRGDRQVPGRP